MAFVLEYVKLVESGAINDKFDTFKERGIEARAKRPEYCILLLE